jgi:ABC-type transport system substrate-binding protein
MITRQALAYLVDYTAIIQGIYRGLVIQSTSPFGLLSSNSAPDLRDSSIMFKLDREKATWLLKESGWKDTNGDRILDHEVEGKRVEFRFSLKVNSDSTRVRVAQVIKEKFRSAGIDMIVEVVELNAMLSDIYKRNVDATLIGWTADRVPDASYRRHSAAIVAGSNFVGYSNSEVNRLCDLANEEMNQDTRSKILWEINRHHYRDQPYLFLTEVSASLVGFSRRVRAPFLSFKYDSWPRWDIFTFVR